MMAEVSIARRRLVVLRPDIKVTEITWTQGCFNRPKAISCLATRVTVEGDRELLRFQSPEGD